MADARLAIRGLLARDLIAVLAINRRAFPDDPWTRDTAGGRLARSPLMTSPRSAARVERLIKLVWLSEAVTLGRLIHDLVLQGSTQHYWIVAEIGRKVVGFARLDTGTDGAEIRTIAVTDQYNGRGVGTALLSNLIATAAARGCQPIRLRVRADSARARRLYQRAGFTELEIHEDYYQPSGTGAVVMQLERAELRQRSR
jgi:ribosomal-protein-alanine acetyltransferase